MAAKGGEGHILSFNFNARPNGEEVGGSFSKIGSQILETSIKSYDMMSYCLLLYISCIESTGKLIVL